MATKRIVITGAAGLVGQNLMPRLKAHGFDDIVAIDKHPANTRILKQHHPDVDVVLADMAESGAWQRALQGCTHLIIAHAQIGGLYPAAYVRNNVTATERLLDAAVKYNVRYTVNISSSVVNSAAMDDYTETKKAQEALVAASRIKQVVLRPTLMFGWFDRKHIGWLGRFMRQVPVFPIPGDGKALRQPLYAGDFADIIASSVEREITGAYNITGQERIYYIDLMRLVKQATGSRARIQKVPYGLFRFLLQAYSTFDKDPPFTPRQLEALVTPDIFEVIDWPGVFGVRSTPLREALFSTFRDPEYSRVVLDF